MKLNHEQLAALKDFASDLLVFAGSCEPGDVSDAMARHRVTETQLRHVMSDLGKPVTDGGAPARFLPGLYEDVTGKTPPSLPLERQGALARLKRCVLSIPSWDAYAALLLDRTGTQPDGPRPGRQDDRPGNLTDDPERLAILLSDAMSHLRLPARVNYVVCGLTSFQFDYKHEADVLDSRCVFVPDDLRRFTDSSLIETFLDEPDLLGKLCVLRHDLKP